MAAKSPQMARPAQTYVYQALTGDRIIRVAEIQPGEHEDPLSITLSETALPRETKIAKRAESKYETLSYEWGQHDRDQPVTCNDKTVLVTRNLEAALRRLRLTGQPRRIWIDSLCIDQENLKERSHQVALMPLIYKSATAVNMWLGEEDPAVTVEGLRMLNNLAALYNYLKDMLKKQEKKKEDPSKHWLNGVVASMDALERIFGNGMTVDVGNQKSWHSLKDIMNRTYFERTWITQEILLSWNATVIIGPHCFPWLTLRKAVLIAQKCQCLPVDRTSLSYFRLYMIATAEKWRWKGASLTMTKLFLAFHMSRCRDPRDMVFGLVGIAQYPHGAISSNVPVELGMPLPDYSKSVEQVYQETTAVLIQRNQDLRIFQNIQIPGMRNLNSMPTWVIDWSPSPEGWWEKYQPSGREKMINLHSQTSFTKNQFVTPVALADAPLFPASADLPISISGGVLTAQGLSLGKVTWISDILRQQGLIQSLVQLYSAVNERYTNVLFDEYANGEPILNALAKTILMGRSDKEAESRGFETTGPGDWTPMFESFLGVIVSNQMFEHADEFEGRLSPEAFQKMCLDQTGAGLFLAAAGEVDNQRLFRTDTRDLMGIAALSVRVDDTVVWLRGACAPLLLRKVPKKIDDQDGREDNDRWKIVCDAYVHGAMEKNERIFSENLCGDWKEYKIV